MKIVPYLAALTLSAIATTSAMAETAAKPVVKTSCADYVALNETIKPQFIYYVVGHGKKGQKEAVFEEVDIEKIKPEVDKFCSINLTKSAYDQVIASSVASEKAYRAQHATKAK
ncbi:acid stress chaperone HdeA [Duganella sp. 1224]|uniref:HdeA/HdeB family chaperone n=1 Tax=Duganella sp. 1224 TaxID=2587052 RepID=UPI0015CAFFF4|nr:HdeA/HdeB family chaperone [Duganella sp. 1224]NYE61729.1 acid stress chaperone HdeA [Duganella sp. 1224]